LGSSNPIRTATKFGLLTKLVYQYLIVKVAHMLVASFRLFRFSGDVTLYVIDDLFVGVTQHQSMSESSAALH
jgi:hypothetical protein